ncbi:MAG: glycosyltransferase family 4 protein, partial [candidate division NC10 bacterium]|nr:glycosyltransferase family 4 protein [candidate division NC10 bacterium]
KAKRRASLGLPIDRRILIFAGSGFARKGVEQILHAMALLPRDDLLLVVGRDKSARAYHRLAQRLGIAARVRFLGVRNDLADLLAAADVLLHPALYEPFGNVVLEALACGCGVIVSDRVGAKDLVRDGENGYICEPMNAQSIVDCLDSCTTQERLASLAEHARQTALHYDISAMSTQLRALYTSLLG